MRLLFKQRPSSAVSLGAETVSNHFHLKSRPASAISRISTVATVARQPALSPTDGFDTNETEVNNWISCQEQRQFRSRDIFL